MSKQETTAEFGFRLNQAIEAHPLSPPTPFGRQKWLIDKLATETGLEVSANTMHKWVNGTARPREDSVRKLARVLAVDEIWLAMGKRPGDQVGVSESAKAPASAPAHVMVLAGLIEMGGGRVTFPEGDSDTASMRANIGGKSIGVITVTGNARNGQVTYLVPEPAMDCRIVAVTSRACDGASVCVDVLDLTDVPRQHLGGYSIITVEERAHAKVKVPDRAAPLAPLARLDELAHA